MRRESCGRRIPSGCARCWPKAARAGIPTLSPHALRHTFGTRWLQADGDIYKLSKNPRALERGRHRGTLRNLLKHDLVAASRQVKIPIAPRAAGKLVRISRRRA